MLRLGTLALALIFVSGASKLALAEPDSEESGDEAGAASGETPTAVPLVEKRRNSGKQKRRRRSKVVGHAVPASQLRTTPLPLPSGQLELFGLASREQVSLDIFNDDGSFDVDELHKADHMLRCKRTDTEKPIDPRLVVLLSHVYDHFKKRLEVVSGYRNQRKQTSFHFKGSASDIRIQGVPPRRSFSSRRRWTPAAWGSAFTRAPSSCTSMCVRSPATAGLTTRAPIRTRPTSAPRAVGSAKSFRADASELTASGTGAGLDPLPDDADLPRRERLPRRHGRLVAA